MKKHFQLWIVILATTGCSNELKENEPTVNQNLLTENEVRDFISNYDGIWAWRDTTRMKEAMAENYVYFTSVGNTSSRDKIIGWFTPADKYRVDTAMRSEISVTIHGNTAVVSSRWKGSGSFDGERFRDDQRCSLTIQKEDGKLKLIAEHCTQIVN